jgi:hypothetical protein
MTRAVILVAAKRRAGTYEHRSFEEEHGSGPLSSEKPVFMDLHAFGAPLRVGVMLELVIRLAKGQTCWACPGMTGGVVASCPRARYNGA